MNRPNDFDTMFKEIPRAKLDRKEFDKFKFNQVIFDMPSTEIATKTNTIARIFGKNKDENFISDLLAFLMENNVEVLHKLLELSNSEDRISTYIISREYVFTNGRRIDFLIESDELLIGIENKIDSKEQTNQLKDYSIDLENISNGRNCIKILLKPKYNNIQAHSGFIYINYEDYVNSLKEIHLDFIQDLRGSFLLLDFIKHMEENIIMSNETDFVFNDWTEYIHKYSDQIQQIQKAAKTEERNILEYIKEKIGDELNDNENWSFGQKRYEPGFIQVFKDNWNKKTNVHYELLRMDKDIIPTKYVVRIDIEGGNVVTKNRIREELGLKNYQNEFMTFDLDYSNEKDFGKSIETMIAGLKKLMEDYNDKIDVVYSSFRD